MRPGTGNKLIGLQLPISFRAPPLGMGTTVLTAQESGKMLDSKLFLKISQSWRMRTESASFRTLALIPSMPLDLEVLILSTSFLTQSSSMSSATKQFHDFLVPQNSSTALRAR